MAVLTKGSGSMARSRVEVDRYGGMEVFMKVIGKIIKHMVMEG